jgi:lipid A 3-O-deacylase
MGKWLIAILLGGCIFPDSLPAQAIDNTLLFKNISRDKYFRINYENDFFTASDRDYTQGILVEKVLPAFCRFPLMRILWHPSNSTFKYGLALEHNAYTPNQIDRYDIQFGDRPFAGVLLFKTFLIAKNEQRKQWLSVSFSTGILGTAAGGELIQRTIHHWINYTQPQGWHNQIHNDLVLNYQVNIEKRIIGVCDHFLLSGYGSLRLGTLSDKLSGGLTAMLGNFRPVFVQPVSTVCHFQWYVYDQLTGNAVGYDATLQGGFFNRSSVYIIPASQLNRLTVQNKFGVVIIFPALYLEYYFTGITEEFSSSIYHKTGGIQIGFGF